MKKTIGFSILVIVLFTTVAGNTGVFKNVPDAAPVSLANTSADHSGSRLSVSMVEDSLQSLYNAIGLGDLGMNYEMFRYGMIGYIGLKLEGRIADTPLMSFIDFTRQSTEKRFYTIDLSKRKVVFHSLVSHGRNSGENKATAFSNTPNSNQSSLGFYITGETYVGSKGYSMRLDGADGRFNDKMRDRAVVMHDAEYVSESWIKKYGRLGRSHGCPALPKEISREVIDTIKDKTVIFAYYDDQHYLTASRHLNLENLLAQLNQTPSVAALATTGNIAN
jgi:hypothetical protein